MKVTSIHRDSPTELHSLVPDDNRPGIEDPNPDRVPPGRYSLLHPVVGLHRAEGASVQHQLAVPVDRDEVRVGPLGV